MEKLTSGIKSKAYLIIVGAFIIGVVTGSLLMNLVMANSPINTKKPSLISDLSSELQLSPEQRMKVEQIYTDSRQRGREILKEVEPRLEELRAKTKANVRTQLTLDQQPRYDRWCQKRDAEKKKVAEEKK